MLFSTSKILIIIENRCDIICFERYFEKPNFHNDYIVLAINASAQSELLRLKIPFIKSDLFFKNKDHITISKKSHHMIEKMRSTFLLKDVLGVNHAYKTEFFSFFKYHYLNYWLAYLIILDNALNKLKPSLILVPPSTYPEDINKDLLPLTSMIGFVCKLYAKRHGYKILICGNTDTPNKEEQKLHAKVLGNNRPELISRFLFNIQLLGYKLMSRRKNVIWSTNSAYNIPRVIDHLNKIIKNSFMVGDINNNNKKTWLRSVLKGKSLQFIGFPSPTSRRDLNIFLNSYDIEINKIFEIMKKNISIFSFMGVDMQKSIIDYLQNGLKARIKYTFYGAQNFARVIKIRKPYFLISNQATGYNYAIGELCAMKEINGMLISHGTHVSHSNKLAKTEWDEQARYMINSHFPFVAAQTSWAQGFLDDQATIFSEVIPTGPLLYSKRDPDRDYFLLRKKLFPNHYNKKIFLHAATPFGWHYFHPWIDLTNDEYIKHINDLIRSIEKMTNVFLAVRVRLKSFPGMSLESVKRLFVKSTCYEIFTEGSFEDYLLCSDILVSFSSTTIEEALQLRIPVLQYDPFDRYIHVPSQKMTQDLEIKLSSIYYVSKRKNLSLSINWILKNHLDVPNSREIIDWSPHFINFSEDWMLPIVDAKNNF